MKILLEKYPKGTFKGQKTDGRYIDGFVYHNLELLAERIVDDMTFLAITFSSTLEVGTGKSVFGTQMGEAWAEIMKKKHNIDVPFTQKNIVFRPTDLIKRAFEVPKYSFLLLDEWEGATYWSELGTTLRQFFQKCRQLNLFIMVIIPNWFQMNIQYAVSRSVFAVDIKFEGNFERGYGDFYSFRRKRDLYIKGKKFHDYHVVRPDFNFRFLNGYGVPEKEYRAAKLKDMLTYEQNNQIPTEREITIKLFKKLRENLPQVSVKDLSKAFGVTRQSTFKWLKEIKDKEINSSISLSHPDNDYTMHLGNLSEQGEIDYSRESDLEKNNEELPLNSQENTTHQKIESNN